MVNVIMVVETLDADVVYTTAAQGVERASAVRRQGEFCYIQVQSIELTFTENVVETKARAGVVANSHLGIVGRRISCSHRYPAHMRTLLSWTAY